MTAKNPEIRREPSFWLSAIIFATTVALMAGLRFYVFPDRIISLSYSLPLLICLWHRDRRLLWSLAGAFITMACFKSFFMGANPNSDNPHAVEQCLFQIFNILTVGATVHAILHLTDRLNLKNAQLEAANDELSAHQEEIARQNEELQAQAEELAHQNEEMQQQGEELSQQNEELGQQAEELQSQAEELQLTNQELNQREQMLQTILTSLRDASDESQMIAMICAALNQLIGDPTTAAAVMEKVGDNLVIRTKTGVDGFAQHRWPIDQTFAAVVMQHDRTAFIRDLAARPDLKVPHLNGSEFRSVLATPLRLNGKCAGVVKIFSLAPREWTSQQFHVIEWVAAQCSLMLETARLREDLTRTNGKLEQLVTDRTAKLQEMINELEHFSYTITHDMRAPLRAMQGFAGIMQELGGLNMNPEMTDCLNRILTSTARMDRLITDALSYSKVVKQELAIVPVDADKLLRGIIGSYPNLQPPKATIQIEDNLPHVLGNEAGLTQCFSNLLNNAVKFIPPGQIAEVRVRADVQDGIARLWFEDNGIGVPPEMKQRIFQMFQRASKDYEGTGVGLALVRKVTERMGGRVGVESEPGKGSRFWLEFKTPPREVSAILPDNSA